MNRLTVTILAIMTFLGITLAATAQRTEYGLRGGVTFNNVRTTDLLDAVAPEFDDLIGYQATAFATIPVAGALSFQPEITVARKGFSFRDGTDVNLFGLPLPVGVRADTRFSYLEAPLLGKISFGNDLVEGFIVAGPAFGYATGGEVKTRTTGLVELDLTSIDIDLDAIGYNRFEVSGIIGAGMAIQAGAGKVHLDGRYQHGFTELYDIPLVTEGVRNRGFIVSAGYAIPLNR